MVAGMKCLHCNGALDVGLSFCPYCGVRADIDLRQVHFRDLGPAEGQKCPACRGQLGGIEFPGKPPVVIERCLSCHGMFFNPGELEAILEMGTWPLVWLDPAGFERIAADFGHRREIVYRACPMCAERMSPYMFGGGSGVIVDRCGTHGLWLEAGGLRRLMEWWRVGGKLIYEQHQREKVQTLYGKSEKPTFRKSVEPTPSWGPKEPPAPEVPMLAFWCEIVGSLLSGWLSHR
jgi:Zn-finger nucleic acid-binding protein